MGETIEKFTLPEGKVHVRFIKKSHGIAANVSENHIISGGMLEGAYRRFPVPMLRSGAYKNVLTEAEKKFFEDKIFQGENLSMYNKKFWDTKTVKLEKLGIVLDKSHPEDYLKLKILLGWNSIVAASLQDYKDNPSPAHQFYLEEEGEDIRLQTKSLLVTKKAWKNFDKIEANRDVLAAVIFLMKGNKVATNADIDYLNGQVSTLVDANPAKFNTLVEDSQFESQVMVANAVAAGIITLVKGAYVSKDGLPLTEKGQPATTVNVVNFLNNPVNNEAKELILSRLDNIKE